MVQVNSNKNEIHISFDGDSNELVEMQKALIRLMQCFDFENYGNSAGEAFYPALNLLDSLIPEHKQQKRALVSESDYLELPENMSEAQKKSIKDAVFFMKHPEEKTGVKSLVYDALKKIDQ